MPKWESHTETLRKFKKKYNHCKVDDENFEFYDWFTLARERILLTHQSSLLPSLTEERIIELVLNIGILDDKNDDAWNNRLKELIQFCKKYKRCPRRDNEDEKSLYYWIN